MDSADLPGTGGGVHARRSPRLSGITLPGKRYPRNLPVRSRRQLAPIVQRAMMAIDRHSAACQFSSGGFLHLKSVSRFPALAAGGAAGKNPSVWHRHGG